MVSHDRVEQLERDLHISEETVRVLYDRTKELERIARAADKYRRLLCGGSCNSEIEEYRKIVRELDHALKSLNGSGRKTKV
ncbi:MAG: hypothetical protein Q8J63_04210 [Candidatus Aquicultor sp.]|nr:hypothetical protein [Candidatus Aquicultor sp.]